MARFSASVQLKQCTTLMGSAAPSSAASRSRQSSTVRAALMAARCPDRPGLALVSVSARVTASMTAGGFGWLVAALSK